MSTIIRGKPPLPVSVNRNGYTILGEKYPRVTSILGCMNKPALVGWAAKSVAEYAVAHRETWEKLPEADALKLLKGSPWSQRDAAADRGSTVHKVVEAFMNGEELPDMTEDELECAIAAETFLKDRAVKVHGTEITVYSRMFTYAGTLDLWCEIDGEDWLLDWKTSGGIYPEYALQLVAYSEAEYAVIDGASTEWAGGLIGHHSSLVGKPPRLGVVHLRNDGYTLHEVKQERAHLEGVWRSLIAVHSWMKTMDGALEVAS